ncbi:bifunctional 4-hydroxy-2-oxoglutarate aldolase/2-dehydro-3-deoxy-phosphogluconate aldolase [Cytophagaceae bacterium DM2B3-1]|uniref:Bifunctional 4-hydroxy-2-oxoglutarate aldolase/2-dehydro-3-deoxy-phosphogluconate aldolase n=1 Tax=Xanthocytophaga flava TaxID=3048013 RepID=A0ABT7CWR3_9BACT|nr:bifunctional 4-hydroxy-2-oxoglutarate aldolase/2-dehydro-3-deoxy-phosphogluconate aldolase [Xanthocytophaga flavus]MDJ1498208.1 bifunctional 4-hydroxy-2-oxoglutarate aldolase/2-dehydro-3-deoxy-phosphogluconate aldolase [Xanthocytophaga flavus]
MNNTFSWDLFYQMPIVGILRNFPTETMDGLAFHYAESGLTNLEITMNSEGAESTIAFLCQKYGTRLNIGAGTVCTLDDLDKALHAGAQFIVTPILDEDVIKSCVAKGVPIFPGAYTPTEIYKAWKWGASMVKVFPASRLGPEFIKEVLAPLNQIKLMPTGGVNLENCITFLKAGAKGLGMGGQLFPKELIQQREWEQVSGIFKQFVEKVQAFQAVQT